MTADRVTEERQALRDTLDDWLTCADPVGRREQLRCVLLTETPYPLVPADEALLMVRRNGDG